jgi:hypothetical protein
MNTNEQSIAQEPQDEEIEGLEISESIGWGEYPLDSVFVRKEQRTVAEVVKRIRADRYILHPDFQRDFVWPLKKQARLIESCLMRIPLPVFYVAEADDGRIIVVDGLQRLTTFIRYLRDDFALSKLGDGREDEPKENFLLGKRFSELPVNLQERVEDTRLTLYILDAKAPQRAKLDIFERVNSGEPLARQQMRNCLFSGPATKWLAAAAESEDFLNATGGTLNKKTMRDRETINRFCAFRLLGEKQYKSDMDGFLAECLEIMNELDQVELDRLNLTFQGTMRTNFLLFGRHAFRKSLLAGEQSTSRTPINISLFDVCSVLFADLDQGVIEKSGYELIGALKILLKDESFSQAITYATNGLTQVTTRFAMMRAALSKVI